MKNGNCPAILDESDVISIVLSNNVFARKVDRVYSSSLIDCFLNYVEKIEKMYCLEYEEKKLLDI